MIEEDYVSFEVAKLLKEKGFEEETEHEIWYVTKPFSTGCHWNACTYKVGDKTREYDKSRTIAMPTVQMAHKWLSEEHELFPMVQPEPIGIYSDGKWDWAGKWIGVVAKLREKDVPIQRIGSFDTCQEAEDAILKYCLEKLI